MKIFILHETAFKELDRNDSRLDWNHPFTSSGYVRYNYRKIKDGFKWTYCEYGTKQECVDRRNKHLTDEIAQKLSEIKVLEARLFKIDTDLGNE